MAILDENLDEHIINNVDTTGLLSENCAIRFEIREAKTEAEKEFVDIMKDVLEKKKVKKEGRRYVLERHAARRFHSILCDFEAEIEDKRLLPCNNCGPVNTDWAYIDDGGCCECDHCHDDDDDDDVMLSSTDVMQAAYPFNVYVLKY